MSLKQREHAEQYYGTVEPECVLSDSEESDIEILVVPDRLHYQIAQAIREEVTFETNTVFLGTVAGGTGTAIGSTSSTRWPRSYSDPNLQRISNLCDNISAMCDVMTSIQTRYKLINVEHDDVYITLASTGEILSLNQLVADAEELKRIKNST